jgi:hypothetical protein
MRLKGIIVVLAAVASLCIFQATPVYATSAAATNAQAVHLAGSAVIPGSPVIPDGLLRSRSVDTKAGGGCGEFKGTLEYYTQLVGKNYEQTYDVTGTLYQHCSGYYTRLYAHYQCDNYTPQGPRIGERTSTGSTKINWGSPQCSYGISNMRIEICFHSSTVFGCAYSDYL